MQVRWQPFMIDPGTAPDGEEYNAYCRRRWGGDGWTRSLRQKGERVGAPFANWKVWPNTLLAHALLAHVGEARESALKERLFEGVYERGEKSHEWIGTRPSV